REQRGEKALEIGGLRLERQLHLASAAGRELELTPTEFRLLHLLMSNAARTLSRAQLVEHLCANGPPIEERSIDAHINRLRRELASSGHDRLVETVPGEGYRFSRATAGDGSDAVP